MPGGLLLLSIAGDRDQGKTRQLRCLKGRQSHGGPMRCPKQGTVFSALRLKPRVARALARLALYG